MEVVKRVSAQSVKDLFSILSLSQLCKFYCCSLNYPEIKLCNFFRMPKDVCLILLRFEMTCR